MAVYLDYDQDELDAQYNLRALIPEHRDFFDRWAAESAAVRKRLKCRLDVAYGKGPGEKMDIFPAPGEGRPILAFIHGGYWRSLDKGDFSFLAPAWVDAGVTFVSINYGLAPDTPLDEIVRQSRAAVEWLRRNARKFGGDKDAIHLAGHSAGGHLAAMVLAEQRLGSVCAVSGLYDLEPVRLTPYVNDDLRLDAETARRNSPLHLRPAAAVPVIAAVGADETPEFLRQNRDFAEAWKARRVELAGLHHFSVVEALGDTDGPLFGMMLDLIDGRTG